MNGGREGSERVDNERDLNEIFRKRVAANSESLEAPGPFSREDLNFERFLSVVEYLREAVFVIDLRGTIVAWNRVLEEMTGVSRKEMLGRNDRAYSLAFYRDRRPSLIDLLGLEDFSHLENRYHIVWRKGRVLHSELYLPSVFEGRGGYLRIAAGPLVDARGEPAGAYESIQDITDRWRLEREILNIQEREQRRIGQDLHDGLCQQLKSVELMAEAMRRRLSSKAPDEVENLTRLQERVNQTIQQARDLARGLLPVQVETQGLMAALKDMMARMNEYAQDVRFSFSAERPVEVADPAIATHLYRIAQEAVQNAFKHAGARNIRVSLAFEANRMLLTIQDDGAGFPQKPVADEGVGLHSMNYRANMIGARLEIESSPGQGTKIVCGMLYPRV